MRQVDELRRLHERFWESVKTVPGVKTTSIRPDSAEEEQVKFVLYVDESRFDSNALPDAFENIHVAIEHEHPAYGT